MQIDTDDFCPADLAVVTGKQHKNVMQAIRNMESAWEKICGLKFQLTSRTISQPNGGTRKITQGKFYLSTYKDPMVVHYLAKISGTGSLKM